MFSNLKRFTSHDPVALYLFKWVKFWTYIIAPGPLGEEVKSTLRYEALNKGYLLLSLLKTFKLYRFAGTAAKKESTGVP